MQKLRFCTNLVKNCDLALIKFCTILYLHYLDSHYFLSLWGKRVIKGKGLSFLNYINLFLNYINLFVCFLHQHLMDFYKVFGSVSHSLTLNLYIDPIYNVIVKVEKHVLIYFLFKKRISILLSLHCTWFNTSLKIGK